MVRSFFRHECGSSQRRPWPTLLQPQGGVKFTVETMEAGLPSVSGERCDRRRELRGCDTREFRN